MSAPSRTKPHRAMFEAWASSIAREEGAETAATVGMRATNAFCTISMLLDRALPADGLGLFVSGRASIEIVQKAWSAGFGAVVAVSAPTALAVEAARRANLMLAGFVRGERFNVYAPERL